VRGEHPDRSVRAGQHRMDGLLRLDVLHVAVRPEVVVRVVEGTLIENLRPGDRNRELVALHQREVDAQTQKDARGRVLNQRDPGRMMAVLRLARAKEREANARRDWLHKVSREIVDRYDFIAVEDLRLRSMTRSAKGTTEAPGKNVAAKAG
jgi:hypothetical protein